MSNGKSYILKVEDKDISSTDGDLSVFNGDLDNSTDIDALHKILGDNYTAEANDSETMSATEHDSSLATEEHSLSALEELELLYGDSTVSDDEDFLLQTSEPSLAEESFNDTTALDELKAFLGDASQAEAGDIETSLMSTLEGSFENHHLVLDELQSLLQSCIDEIKEDTKSTIIDVSVIADADADADADAVYPSRDELQNLLEAMLSQLMLYSEDSFSTTSTESASVLDELKNFMFEEDEYEVSATDEEEAMTHTPSESIIDELNLLLGNSNPDIPDAQLESEYSAPTISDENPVQDELAAYMAELSSDAGIDEENPIEKSESEVVDAEVDSALSTLEELETMLNEIGVSDNDDTRGSIQASDDDLSYESESKRLSVSDNREKKAKADTSYHNELQSNTTTIDKTTTEKTAISSTPVEDDVLLRQSSSGRVPKAGLLYVTAVAAAIYGIWSQLNTSDEIDHSAEKHVIQQYEPDSMVVLDERSTVPASAEEDSIYALLARTEESRYVSVSSYESEILNSEINETDIKDAVTTKPYEEFPDKEYDQITENESKELSSLQVKNIQQENRESLNQLDKRMIEAEMSIALLQAENKIIDDQKDLVEPLRIESSEVSERPQLSVKQAVTEPPVQKVAATEAQVKNDGLWSVYLSSYYGKPPPASELEYLGNAGISYEIKKAIVDEKVWYRVIVDDFSAYEKAMEYSNGVRKNVGRDDIWVNRSQ